MRFYMNLQKSISFIFIVPFIIIFNGCDNSIEPLEKGTCEVNVSGYVVKSYHGQAIFENVPSLGGRKIFFMHLKDNNLSNDEYRYVEFSGSQPDIGTYELINIENNNSNEGKFIGIYNDSGSYGSYKSIGGRIGITYVRDNEIKGWFDFPAYENVPINNGESRRVEIKISGEFYATEGHTGIIVD